MRYTDLAPPPVIHRRGINLRRVRASIYVDTADGTIHFDPPDIASALAE